MPAQHHLAQAVGVAREQAAFLAPGGALDMTRKRHGFFLKISPEKLPAKPFKQG
jgi:hypothetical protein